MGLSDFDLAFSCQLFWFLFPGARDYITYIEGNKNTWYISSVYCQWGDYTLPSLPFTRTRKDSLILVLAMVQNFFWSLKMDLPIL